MVTELNHPKIFIKYYQNNLLFWFSRRPPVCNVVLRWQRQSFSGPR